MRQLRLLLVSSAVALVFLLACAAMAGRVVAAPPAVVPAAFTTPRTIYPVVDTPAITHALAYLRSVQGTDGGFPGFVPNQSDDFTTIKVALALHAAHLTPNALTSTGGQTALDYLASRAFSYTRDLSGTLFPGRLGLLTLAVAAGDIDPASFGPAGQPLNLIAAITGTYQPASGAYSTTAQLGLSSGAANALSQAYVLLGLAAAQQPVPAEALAFLRAQQEPDGGWGFGFGGDVDTTALVIQAMIANGVAPTDTAIQAGLAFLRSQQLAGGGWGFGGSPSADATAFVIQAAAAAGFLPATASWSTAGGDPQSALLALQGQDGSFGENALGTAHAIAGLAQQPLPMFGLAQRAERALAAISASQGSDGAWSFFGAPTFGGSLDVILAFSAAGYSPDLTRTPTATSALTFLAAEAFTYTHDLTGTLFPTQAGKTILALVAGGVDPTNFALHPGGGTFDLVGELQTSYVTATGAYSTTALRGPNSGAASSLGQSFAMLALAAAGQPIPAEAITFLRGLQASDGSWGSIDVTSLALQAMRAAGVNAADLDLVAAVAFLRNRQDTLGGWDNPNSTAYAMQGLLAMGENLTSDWLKNGRSPYQALALYQKPDGPFTYTWEEEPFFTPGATNDLSTWQAVPALLGVSYPLRPTPGSLRTYSPTLRGPSPDRLVALAPNGRIGATLAVSVPFGSDLNRDATADFAWRPVGASAWTTATLGRADGVFTATLALSGAPRDYELRVVFSDPDGVQNGASQAPTLTLTTVIAAQRVYLPFVGK